MSSVIIRGQGSITVEDAAEAALVLLKQSSETRQKAEWLMQL